MTDTQSTLKPNLDWSEVEIDAKCLKCGSTASPDIFVCGQDKSLDLFAVRCDDDESCGMITALYKTIEEAIEAWSRRA